MPVGDVTLRYTGKSEQYSYTGITPEHDTVEPYIEARNNNANRPSYAIELLTIAYDSTGVAQASDTPLSTFVAASQSRVIRPKLRGLLIGQLYRIVAFAIDYNTRDILSEKLILVGTFDQVKTMWSAGVEASIPPPTAEPAPIATIYTEVPGYDEPVQVEVSPTGEITVAQQQQEPRRGGGLLKGLLVALAAFAIAKGARK